MTVILFAAGAAVLAALAIILQWWFSGGGTRSGAYDPLVDALAIAEGFPELKYRALCRLLDPLELRSMDRDFSMPADLIQRLDSGRREVVHLYLSELEEEFRRALRLYAHAQATGFTARPSAVRELAAGWWRFRNLSRRARRSATRGELTCRDVEPLVKEAQAWVEKLTGTVAGTA